MLPKMQKESPAVCDGAWPPPDSGARTCSGRAINATPGAQAATPLANPTVLLVVRSFAGAQSAPSCGARYFGGAGLRPVPPQMIRCGEPPPSLALVDRGNRIAPDGMAQGEGTGRPKRNI